MQKKFDFILKLGMILFSIFIIIFFVVGMKANEFIINDKTFLISSIDNIILSFFFAITFLIFFFSVPPFGFLTYYLIYRSVTQNKIRKNAKFEQKNLEYCREHLNYLSPTILSYLDNFELEYEKDISAHILKLIYEKYIIVENNQLQLSNKEMSNLSESDLFILNIVKKKKINFQDKIQYKNIIENEARNQGLLTNKDITLKKFIGTFFIGCFLIPAIMNLFVFKLANNIDNNISIIYILIIIISIMLPIIAFIYTFVKLFSILNIKTNMIRTKKGNKILKDAIGLKFFIKDFSNLENSSWKEVYTRDYYLIYAIILEINKKIPKEIMEMLS